MQCEATGQPPKGRCSSLVLLISLAQHWLCLVVSHRAVPLPQDSQCSSLKTMQDKNLSTILRLPLCVWADTPDTQDTFKQQQGGNSTSNHKCDTSATRMHTLALRGTTNTLCPVCPCSNSWGTVQTPQLSLHTAGFAHMVMDFTHWDTHLFSSWQAKVWPAPPNCWSELTALTFRKPGQVQHNKQLDWYISKI